jgi:hypothetical protein
MPAKDSPGIDIIVKNHSSFCSISRGRTFPLTLAVLIAQAMSFGATGAAAQTGSGTVAFTFTNFLGPFAAGANSLSPADATQYSLAGTVNGAMPSYVSYNGGTSREVVGQLTIPTGTTSVTLQAPSNSPNGISFAPRPFTNVALGQDFVLGTLTFENGAWFGAINSAPAGIDPTTHLGFEITTTSPNGSAFNQTIAGTITMHVYVAVGADPTTLAGQNAQADWLTIESPAVVSSLGAFRVYEDCCRPPGFTSVGSVDLVARFNSLDLIGFANPTGAFVTPSVDPLPITGAVTTPEPATWVLVATGLAAGVVARRRRTDSAG